MLFFDVHDFNTVIVNLSKINTIIVNIIYTNNMIEHYMYLLLIVGSYFSTELSIVACAPNIIYYKY